MAKTVVSFSSYVSSYAKHEEMFETCVTAMERGLLHVDTINADGPLGKYFWNAHGHHSPDMFGTGTGRCIQTCVCFGVLCIARTCTLCT